VTQRKAAQSTAFHHEVVDYGAASHRKAELTQETKKYNAADKTQQLRFEWCLC
jgi:hypothetical protein